ncbi:PLC phosphodiesterase [Salix suchowensis]|nr:PLC phosphodiesterase [Salix suchowensis]
MPPKPEPPVKKPRAKAATSKAATTKTKAAPKAKGKTAEANVSPALALATFGKYADEDSPEVIGPEGFSRLCEDADASLEGPLPLIIAWLMDAGEMAKITKEEWTKGTSKLQIASISQLAVAASDLDKLLIQNLPPLKKPATASPSKKKLPDEPYDRTAYWNYAADSKVPPVDATLTYVLTMFRQILDFCHTVKPDLSGYEADGARRETDSALFGRSKLLLAPYDESGKLSTMNWGIDPETFVLHMSMALSASWQPLRVAGNCPWRVYCSKVSSKLKRILIFPHRDLAKFLAEMPDEGRLSSLTLPEFARLNSIARMAFYGWPISQCQSLSTPLKVQLESGIRVIDVRLAIVDGRLISYHGIYPQKTPFQDILKTIHGFFASSPKETIVMSIKQEDYAHTPAPEFSALVHKEIFDGPEAKSVVL